MQTFAEFDTKLHNKEYHPQNNDTPATLEGCVVRIADTIAYLGRDIEDAITLGVISREDIPKECTEILGNTNGTIVYNLVTDLIANSCVAQPVTESADCASKNTPSYIDFSKEVSEALYALKTFNYQRIYLTPEIKADMPLIKECYTALFAHYLEKISKENDSQFLFFGSESKDQPDGVIARDFIAGMTDDFFLTQAQEIGCKIPTKRTIQTSNASLQNTLY